MHIGEKQCGLQYYNKPMYGIEIGISIFTQMTPLKISHVIPGNILIPHNFNSIHGFIEVYLILYVVII